MTAAPKDHLLTSSLLNAPRILPTIRSRKIFLLQNTIIIKMDNQNAQMCIKFLAPGFITPHPKSIDEKMGSSTILHMRDEQVKVIKLSPSLVVKCGTGVTEAEAKALLLISEKAPNVPVPKVLAYYTYGPVDKRLHGIRRPVFETFIFMSYVEGERLKVAWEAYDTTAKRRVADQLKTYLCDLRGITGGKYIGSVNQGPLKDRILFDSFNKGRSISMSLCRKKSA